MPEIVRPEWVVHGAGDERTPIYSCHVDTSGARLATGGAGANGSRSKVERNPRIAYPCAQMRACVSV